MARNEKGSNNNQGGGRSRTGSSQPRRHPTDRGSGPATNKSDKTTNSGGPRKR